ncbi:MAG: ROK family protein [Candidatus Berkelbacteria bacterium]|nr:ROK family protein [Candidatus Berkelbacteria bacterium]
MGQEFVGIDVGTATIKAGVVDEKNRVFETLDPPTPTTAAKFNEIVLKTLKIIGAHHKITAVGVGLPGLYDYKSQENLHVANLKYDLEELKEKSPLPIFFGNDADMALLGELELRPEIKKENVALLTIGTGVGGAFTINGKMPYELNLAGEVGHMKIMAGGRECSCGQKGCLQAYAGGRAIEKEAEEKYGKKLSAKQIFELAREGDKKARDIVYEMSEALGVGIANLVNILGVTRVILAGKISKSADLIFEFMHESDQNNIFAFKERPYVLEASSGPDEIGIVGAANFAKLKLDKKILP